MDRGEIETMLLKATEELSATSDTISRLETELAQAQIEYKRVEAIVDSLKGYLNPNPAPDTEGVKLTEAIIMTAKRAGAGGIMANVLALKALRLAPSKSADPQRVAMVRIGQLVNEGKLRAAGGRLLMGPNA